MQQRHRNTLVQADPRAEPIRQHRRRRAALLELGVRPRLASNTAGRGLGSWYLAKAKVLSDSAQPSAPLAILANFGSGPLGRFHPMAAVWFPATTTDTYAFGTSASPMLRRWCSPATKVRSTRLRARWPALLSRRRLAKRWAVLSGASLAPRTSLFRHVEEVYSLASS
jgi:hypothetical protein